MISIRISEWMERTNAEELIFKVSDTNYYRIDRSTWDAEKLNQTALDRRYDAHLPKKSFLPFQWFKIKPLLYLMYGGNRSQKVKWCEDYVQKFNAKVINFITFNDID